MFNYEFPNEVNIVFETLSEHGYEGWLAGGCVRDIIMGKIPDDYDFAVSSLPEETCECFKNFPVFKTGLQHGTVMVKINNFHFEITTFRTEGEYLDFRHPSGVFFTPSVDEDLKRRDFTVNAMAYNPQYGLKDLFGGQNDIENKIIRCVGNPYERFSEDALRIMRALRFSSVLGFDIERKTAEAIHNQKELLKNIAVERIYVEFIKLICKNPDNTLNEFRDVFEFLFGELNSPSLDSLPKDKILRLALLFKNTEPLKKLKADGNTLKSIKEIYSFFSEQKKEDSELLYSLGNLKWVSREIIYNYQKYSDTDKNYLKRIENSINEIDNGLCVSLSSLSVNGSDLIEIGIKPGAEIKKILNLLLWEVMEGKSENSKQLLLKRAIKIGDIYEK